MLGAMWGMFAAAQRHRTAAEPAPASELPGTA